MSLCRVISNSQTSIKQSHFLFSNTWMERTTDNWDGTGLCRVSIISSYKWKLICTHGLPVAQQRQTHNPNAARLGHPRMSRSIIYPSGTEFHKHEQLRGMCSPNFRAQRSDNMNNGWRYMTEWVHWNVSVNHVPNNDFNYRFILQQKILLFEKFVLYCQCPCCSNDDLYWMWSVQVWSIAATSLH